MRFLLFFSFLSLTLLLGCKEDDLCNKGNVQFTNTSSNPYDLWVDNEYRGRIEGKSSINLELWEGQNSARVKQVSGYLLFPTEKSSTISVFGCQDSSWVFP